MSFPSTALLGFIAAACLVSARPAPRAQEAIPPYLAGEWAAADAEFANDALSSGSALYLDADGSGALIGAPPPIGMRIRARFDSAAATVVATVLDDEGKPRDTVRITYDAAEKTLALPDLGGGPQPFHRRKDSVPEWMKQMISEAAGAGR
jgi:hypothetical protein